MNYIYASLRILPIILRFVVHLLKLNKDVDVCICWMELSMVLPGCTKRLHPIAKFGGPSEASDCCIMTSKHQPAKIESDVWVTRL